MSPKFNGVKSYFAACIAIAITGTLIAADFFTLELAPLVIGVLWVMLLAAITAMIVQITHAEKALAKHMAQFAANKERLANEIKYRLWAEKTSSENKSRLQIVDENFPVMLAYFNTEQQCRYHNRAYRLWFGLKAEQIDNHFLGEFLNEHFQYEIKNSIESVLAGELVQGQRTQKLANGATCLITEQFVPHFDPKGKVTGFYTLYTPRILKESERIKITSTFTRFDPSGAQNDREAERRLDNKHSSPPPIDSAARIIQAIEQNKFYLHYQSIVPVRPDISPPPYYEILVRMSEEENNLLPPGVFLSIAEKYKLMPRLDRWVVNHLTLWLSKQKTKSDAMLCINIARDTLDDAEFIDFVKKQLHDLNIPAQALCFEIEESDAKTNVPDTAIFAQKMREMGCKVSLSGFNHDRSSFNLLKNIKIDFVKIDGNLICNILHDASDFTKVSEINRIAHLMKIQTIAEFVESHEVIEKLREIKIDFAQGYGIAPPCSLKELE
ncbi:Diguanylate phosphodiesterase [Nitrosomonas nitrosa]|uniref:Diguanylate phosphodiesterase n=1 Tax=Nitrosomonas nitrosa TaxID=52442 RepID=A0A8H8YZ93_9PROT|nr:EAL domain-containing protein [Nitrosomonas nitrosa]CAE6491386.1 Diguanylate phosphodiesterase [Nitrosomonas nitrosa]